MDTMECIFKSSLFADILNNDKIQFSFVFWVPIY